MERPCSIIDNTIWIILRIEKVFCNRFAHPWILLQLVLKLVIWMINADWSTKKISKPVPHAKAISREECRRFLNERKLDTGIEQ